MKKYTYGGYIVTGGHLDDGGNWSGVSVLLGEIPDGQQLPMFGRACPGSGRNKELLDSLETLAPGTVVYAFFGMPDSRGKVKLEALQPVG